MRANLPGLPIGIVDAGQELAGEKMQSISGLSAVVLAKQRKADTYAADQEFRVFE